MNRRDLLGALGALLPSQGLLASQPDRGKLVIVGGAENRWKDRSILRSFLEHAGGSSARVRLLVAATSRPAEAAESYVRAFSDLGVKDCEALPVVARTDAFLPEVSKSILEANAVFITGGDQARLMTVLWETPAMAALHRAHHLGSCCIGGTSAGAAAMSRHMIADGVAVHRARKGVVETDIGLGLLTSAIVAGSAYLVKNLLIFPSAGSISASTTAEVTNSNRPASTSSKNCLLGSENS